LPDLSSIPRFELRFPESSECERLHFRRQYPSPALTYCSKLSRHLSNLGSCFVCTVRQPPLEDVTLPSVRQLPFFTRSQGVLFVVRNWEFRLLFELCHLGFICLVCSYSSCTYSPSSIFDLEATIKYEQDSLMLIMQFHFGQ